MVTDENHYGRGRRQAHRHCRLCQANQVHEVVTVRHMASNVAEEELKGRKRFQVK